MKSLANRPSFIIIFSKSKPQTKKGNIRKKVKQFDVRRKRFEAPLLHPEDFPTDEKEALKDYGLEVEKMKIEEKKRGFGFRSHRRGAGKRK